MSEQNLLKRKHENDDLLDNQNEKNLELDESYVTMVDVLNEEEKLEEDAYAVLGGSDDKNCTYEQGYIKRQALYSCKTCMGDKADEENVFGVCLACSYACHGDHDLFELYTKRQFRCDCGTSKMKNKACSIALKPENSVNENNKYNHNFVGNYCLCDKPYPNPEENEKEEEMVQCIVCEDWFHENCLGCIFPAEQDFAELICKKCMEANKFLWYYQTETVKIKNDDLKSEIDVESEDMKIENEANNSQSTENKTEAQNEKNEEMSVSETEKSSSVENEQRMDEQKSASKELKIEENGHDGDKNIIESQSECKLKALKTKVDIEIKQGTTFWKEGWRFDLCRCAECLNLYAKQNLEFLIDETDTVHHYEAKGKEKGQKLSQYEQGLNEISKIDRVAGIEALMEYKNMSEEFKEHFKKFAEDKKVVNQRDIEEFFATLKYKKRMKLDHSF